jgi:hypothetical protein
MCHERRNRFGGQRLREELRLAEGMDRLCLVALDLLELIAEPA